MRKRKRGMRWIGKNERDNREYQKWMCERETTKVDVWERQQERERETTRERETAKEKQWERDV